MTHQYTILQNILQLLQILNYIKVHFNILLNVNTVGYKYSLLDIFLLKPNVFYNVGRDDSNCLWG